MNRTTFACVLGAAAALAGCTEDHTINAGGPEQGDTVVNTNVKLPPAIVGSHKYRCKDNSLLSIDWMSDGTDNSARVKPESGAAVTLAQAEAGGPYTAEGASLTGDPQAQSITYKGQSCKR